MRYFLVHTGSWLFGKNVLIVPTVISTINDEEKFIEIDLTREKIKNSPEVNTILPVSRHYEQDYYRYYGGEQYWAADPIYDPGLNLPLPPLEEKSKLAGEPVHPHLRSSNEVRNYNIHALVGNIGHVEDFIIEDQSWAIRYL